MRRRAGARISGLLLACGLFACGMIPGAVRPAAAQTPRANQAPPARQAPPTQSAPARRVPPPAAPSVPASAAQTPGGSIAACDYITADEAKGVLGPDVTASMAPSKGSFTSCGYTSPAGDAITISVADYMLPSVAQQFFDKTRELLKVPATNEETIGAPAFSYVTPGTGGPGASSPAGTGGTAGAPASAPAPATRPAAAPPTTPAAAATPKAASTPGAPGAPGAPPAPTPPFAVVTLLALKDHRTVQLAASGPVAGLPQQLPKLRAILTRMLGTLPAPPPPDPPR